LNYWTDSKVWRPWNKSGVLSLFWSIKEEKYSCLSSIDLIRVDQPKKNGVFLTRIIIIIPVRARYPIFFQAGLGLTQTPIS
jgi:hypothetical protein